VLVTDGVMVVVGVTVGEAVTDGVTVPVGVNVGVTVLVGVGVGVCVRDGRPVLPHSPGNVPESGLEATPVNLTLPSVSITSNVQRTRSPRGATFFTVPSSEHEYTFKLTSTETLSTFALE
jgi:hypothetical protein